MLAESPGSRQCPVAVISNVQNILSRRDLMRELTLAQLRRQTSETRLGWVWWLIDPLVMMVIYTAVVVGLFGRGKHYDPYAVFVLCALLPWKHFTDSFNAASKLLRSKEGLIKSIAFPTMILPLSTVTGGTVYFLVGEVVLVVVALAVGKPIGVSIIQLFPLLLLQIFLVSGMCLMVACFGTLVRDLPGFLAHIVRMMFYATPCLYGVDMVVERFKVDVLAEKYPLAVYLPDLYMMNPFAALITGYREAIFYGGWLDLQYWTTLTVETVIVFVAGFKIYQYYDRRVIKFL